MNRFEIRQGDCIERLREMESCSVQACITSPPYWGLRNYGVDGQIGLERTPEMYVSKIVDVFREARRVLKDNGTLWLNLGDSYATGAGSGRSMGGKAFGKQNEVIDAGSYPACQPNRMPIPGLKPKDMVGIPWMVAFALRSDGWYLRQEIIWHKPNPMPESVRDRCTKAHEQIFLLSKQPRYYFDHEAIKEQSSEPHVPGNKSHKGLTAYENGAAEHRTKSGLVIYAEKQRAKAGAYSFARKVNEEPKPGAPRQHREDREDVEYRGSANKRSVWTVTTKPFSEAHFATFPPDLIQPCVLAGCPEGGTILDPFNGAGTTGLVALRHNRNYIGLELNPEYVEMSRRRILDDAPLLNQEVA